MLRFPSPDRSGVAGVLQDILAQFLIYHTDKALQVKGSRGPRNVSKKSLPQLKRVLWDVFSLYIRQRDTDEDGCGSCISCGKSLEIGTKDCQAGHYIPKGRGGSHYLGLPRFPNDELAERNVNLQCAACNLVEGGNFLNYEKGLRQKYGDVATDELKEAGAINPVFKRTKPDLIEIIEHYKSLLA